jgi:predicted nucleotidyltransferase
MRKVFRLSKRIGEDLLTIDLLLLPPFLKDVWKDRESYEVDGIPVTVVDRNGLIAMKKSAGRHQDLSDIENLESTS